MRMKTAIGRLSKVVLSLAFAVSGGCVQVPARQVVVRVLRGAIWLDGVHIPPFQFAHGIGAHDPDRARKLLLHDHEIERLGARVAQERVALVPLSLYFKDGRVKVELGVGKGRRKGDKRQAGRARTQREMQRALGPNAGMG